MAQSKSVIINLIMSKYRKASHITYDCRYHIVWITKFRRNIFEDNKKLTGRTKQIVTKISKELYLRVMEVNIEKDHVHMYVSIPIAQPIPYVMQRIKGGSSREIRLEFKEYLSKFYWKNVLWARGYFIATVGEITDEAIRRYIQKQGKDDVLGDDEVVEL